MTTNQSTIPAEQAKEIRRLSHDLSNALEIIVQANYLLSAMPHDESAKQWIQLLDNGCFRRRASTAVFETISSPIAKRLSPTDPSRVRLSARKAA